MSSQSFIRLLRLLFPRVWSFKRFTDCSLKSIGSMGANGDKSHLSSQECGSSLDRPVAWF